MEEQQNIKQHNKQEITIVIFVLFCTVLALAEIFGNVMTELWHI